MMALVTTAHHTPTPYTHTHRCMFLLRCAPWAAVPGSDNKKDKSVKCAGERQVRGRKPGKDGIRTMWGWRQVGLVGSTALVVTEG